MKSVFDDTACVSLLMELAPRGSLRSLLSAQSAEVVGVLNTQRQLLHGIASGTHSQPSTFPISLLYTLLVLYLRRAVTPVSAFGVKFARYELQLYFTLRFSYAVQVHLHVQPRRV